MQFQHRAPRRETRKSSPAQYLRLSINSHEQCSAIHMTADNLRKSVCLRWTTAPDQHKAAQLNQVANQRNHRSSTGEAPPDIFLTRFMHANIAWTNRHMWRSGDNMALPTASSNAAMETLSTSKPPVWLSCLMADCRPPSPAYITSYLTGRAS